MTKTVLQVEGMSCNHCVKAVNDALSALSGVVSVSVSLEEKTAAIEHDNEICTIAMLKEAVEGQGFDVTGV